VRSAGPHRPLPAGFHHQDGLICDPDPVEPTARRSERLRERVESKPPTLWRALMIIIAVTVVFVVLGAVAMRLADPDEFTNMGDALWFSVVTVSTVGYGDFVPNNGPGKIVASVIMIFGLAFVPAVTAIVIQTNMTRRRMEAAPSAPVGRDEPESADPDRQNGESG
jgi:cytochrome c biogenesis protein CcdA